MLRKAIHARRDELIALAIANGGNTRGDAKFDIDGASGTLAAYADLGAKLGDAQFLADGERHPARPLARASSASTCACRAHGVAVHINAFNFPAWGLAEKLACALLAGMPVITKPATATALVAHRIVELSSRPSVLPPGALSLRRAAAPGDLLDAPRRGRTCSRSPARRDTARDAARATRTWSRTAVRVNVEADSLNAAVLGPDVDAGSRGRTACSSPTSCAT